MCLFGVTGVVGSLWVYWSLVKRVLGHELCDAVVCSCLLLEMRVLGGPFYDGAVGGGAGNCI